MAREQPNVGELLPLLESSDLRQLEDIKGLINEHLNSERGSVLLNSLVDYFLETNSGQALHILSSVREPHDKHLLDKMNECMAKHSCRLPTLNLLGHVVRKQPSWIHKIARYPLLLSLLKCLKTDTDVVVLITGVLVLITLLPMIPQAGKQHLYEFFDIFGRLASWNLKNPGHVSEVYLIHLHASVYSLFHRLYGMYPCNFVSYLRSHYSMKENMETFEEVVKPMLEHVRIHPELVTGTKDHELDPTRWKRFEVHDIVIECAKVSLDPKEASCEEGYATMPEHFSAHLQLRPTDSTASPYTDFHSSFGSSSSTQFSTPRQSGPPPVSLPPLSGTLCRSPPTTRRQNSSCESNSTSGIKDPLWSPSSLCGMATPPSSRGMSPNPELSHSASHLPSRVHNTSVGGKGTPSSSTPATASPPPSLSDEFPVSLLAQMGSSTCKDGKSGESNKHHLIRHDPIRELDKESTDVNNHRDGAGKGSSMTLTELSVYMKEQEQLRTEKEREDAAITEELLKLTEDKPVLCGFESPFLHTTETLTSCVDDDDKPCVVVPTAGPTSSFSHDGPLHHPLQLHNNNTTSTPTTTLDKAGGGRGEGSRGPPVQDGSVLPWAFQPVFTPIEAPPLGPCSIGGEQVPHHHQRSPCTSTTTTEEDALKLGLLSPSPCRPPVALPYEALFDLALPRAASLFVARKTLEATRRATIERRGHAGGGGGGLLGFGLVAAAEEEEELDLGKALAVRDGEVDGELALVEGELEEGELSIAAASPLEVLDRLVQQGNDVHDKVLKRLPLPSKSADWTHFGGPVPLDELHTLRSQLLLLHNQLLYERYKREQHAVRNRRLLRRIINATALEEQNNAMKEQLNLQSVEMISLRDSLSVEQQRYRQLWDDRETLVTRLHSQVRTLQQSREDHYTKNQELESKLQECQKQMGEMEAELQRANNKVCHTGHLLNQVTAKLSTSESTQQQMGFLSKQLLLLGEAHKLTLQELQHSGHDTTKEKQMVKLASAKEAERLRQSLLSQAQKLEAAQQRATELETQLSKKEHLIAEQKKFLEDVKLQAKGELQASESRCQAQRHMTQALQAEVLQLYSRLEMELDAPSNATNTPAGAIGDAHVPTEASVSIPDGPAKAPGNQDGPPPPNGNISTLSPGQPKHAKPSPSSCSSPSSSSASSSSSTSSSFTSSANTSINGSRDGSSTTTQPPSLVEPPPPLLGLPPRGGPPRDAPLTVGSYPSAKSFLGMRARELFRNKSESHCGEEDEEEEDEEDEGIGGVGGGGGGEGGEGEDVPIAGEAIHGHRHTASPSPRRLTSLSQELKTELCVESRTSGPKSAMPTASPHKQPPPKQHPQHPKQQSCPGQGGSASPATTTNTSPASVAGVQGPAGTPRSSPAKQARATGALQRANSRERSGVGSPSNAATATRPRQKQLKIMDYNETHQESN
ncbi:TSC complex subunit 1b isoform X2 [Engraulis encrasicolus]|uniref:TSC complex subunit 1b isoform X2 n=1 Tax=Engraulis encrasicolus TaxID=184585 RepID=UPI002FCF36C0